MQVTFKLSKQAVQILQAMQTLPEWGTAAVAAAMDKANALALANIQANHLRGQGPFPVEEHRLGMKSGRLFDSAVIVPAVVSGQTISSGIGSNVVYAKIHEFGGTIRREAHERELRFKTERVKGQKERVNKRGEVIQEYKADSRRLAKQGKNGQLWVFAKAADEHAQTVSAKVAAYEFEMPARAPFTTGIQEKADTYGRVVSKAIVDGWNAHKEAA